MAEDVVKTEETEETVEKTETEPAAEAKSFSQEEVDAIVKSRLERDRAKRATSAAETESRRQEAEEALKQANDRISQLEAEKARDEAVRNVSRETGVPFDVVAMLSAADEEGLKQQATTLKSAMPVYPTTRDKGETPKPAVTRESILAIEDRGERERAIAANIDLF